MTPEQLIEKLSWRYATKAFDPERKIPEEMWTALEESLRLAPSSFGLQPWKFIIITDQELKEKLLPYAANQKQITTCSHLVVLCTRSTMSDADVNSHIEEIAKTRSLPVEALKDYQNMIHGFINNPSMQQIIPQWSAKQAYIALGFLIEAAALFDIDSCPMEGFDKTGFDNVLGIESQGFTTTVLCPVGYRSKDDSYQHAKKVRFSREQIIEHR